MRRIEFIFRAAGTITLPAILLIAVFMSGCEKKSDLVKVDHVPVQEPDQYYRGSRMIITENGVTSAIVEAEGVQVYMDEDFTAIEGGLVMDFFNKTGERTSILTANSGGVWGLYDDVDSLKAMGNVVIVSEDSTKRMETASSLTWLSKTHRIYADSLVRLVTESGVEQGINFEAAEDLSEYHMDNVSGEIESTDFTMPGK